MGLFVLRRLGVMLLMALGVMQDLGVNGRIGGCRFQTRCGWTSKVPGGLCDKEVPQVRILAEDHQIKCHPSGAELSAMDPVIQMAAQ